MNATGKTVDCVEKLPGGPPGNDAYFIVGIL